MSNRSLEKLFSPKSIAVIGASDKRNSVGRKIFKNLLHEKFKGKVYAVNPKHKKVQGQRSYPSVKAITGNIDLAVVAAPAKAVPQIIKECGEKNIHAVIVLSSGFSETGPEGKALENQMLQFAEEFQISIIGPNCLGVMRPCHHMNATFDNNVAYPGSMALVSQSGALSAGILDWAMNKKIGFSAIVSLGNCANTDFGDILDYLAHDPHTNSILLYIEGIKKPKQFISALRAAARIKPVIVIKSGKNKAGSRAALSHTGVLIGDDDVFDTALHRAGAVRVAQIEDLFSASEILTSAKKVTGNRLIIITNGGGAGVMAADRASELNIELAELTEPMVNALDKVLPSQWSHQNPIDIIGDATPERYHTVLDICNKDENIDGILTLLVPVAMSDPLTVAKTVIRDSKKFKKIIFASWLGEKQVKSSWKLFAKNHIPNFATPEKAVEAFSYLADYHHNQTLLMQKPAPYSDKFKPDISAAKKLFNEILSNNRFMLTTFESKKILKYFGIPVTETIEAETVEEAVNAAKSIGFPVVMKINSPSILHKSKVGGVFTQLKTEKEVRDSFKTLINNIKNQNLHADILGVTIEPQYPNIFDREIMVGMVHDRVFGPVISFGAGGTLVEIIQDKALALPPLNYFIADELISKARILKPASKFVTLSPDQKKNIIDILLRVSEMICEFPQIKEMDINPFILNEHGMIAVDARFVIQKPESEKPYSHLVIQ